jgi:hypothetical protein
MSIAKVHDRNFILRYAMPRDLMQRNVIPSAAIKQVEQKELAMATLCYLSTLAPGPHKTTSQ